MGLNTLGHIEGIVNSSVGEKEGLHEVSTPLQPSHSWAESQHCLRGDPKFNSGFLLGR